MFDKMMRGEAANGAFRYFVRLDYDVDELVSQ